MPVLGNIQRWVSQVSVHANIVQGIRSSQPAFKTERFLGKLVYSRQMGSLHRCYEGLYKDLFKTYPVTKIKLACPSYL